MRRQALFLPSRPLLECLIRQRVRNISNISVVEAHDVVDLTTRHHQDRVTGVRVRAHNGGAEDVLAAELVVDATGRGSRTPTRTTRRRSPVGRYHGR